MQENETREDTIIKEITEKIIFESHLKENDYFDTNVFYYMAGRFPDLTISQCADIVNRLRESNQQVQTMIHKYN